MAISTPWGISQKTDRLGLGILEIQTLVHGGIGVPVLLRKKFPPAFRGLLKTDWALQDDKYFWFERDQNFCISVIAFPFIAKTRDRLVYAIDTLRDWHPDLYEALYGVKLTPANSYLLHIEAVGFDDS